MVTLVRDMLLNGKGRTAAMETIKEQFGITNQELLEYAYQKGVEYFQSRTINTLELQSIIASHIQEYELLYQSFKQEKDNSGMLRSLRQKEALLGYHNDTKVVEFNQENNTIIENHVGSGYDLSKLTIAEKKRWQELMSKVTSSG
jgi:hypothetical protein